MQRPQEPDLLGVDPDARPVSRAVGRRVAGLVAALVLLVALGPRLWEASGLVPTPQAAPAASAPPAPPPAPIPAPTPAPAVAVGAMSTLLAWPLRGDLAGDLAFVAGARARVGGGRGRDLQSLWAGSLPDGGRLYLAGLLRNDLGPSRVAVFAVHVPPGTPLSDAPVRPVGLADPSVEARPLVGWLGQARDGFRPLVLVGPPELERVALSSGPAGRSRRVRMHEGVLLDRVEQTERLVEVHTAASSAAPLRLRPPSARP